MRTFKPFVRSIAGEQVQHLNATAFEDAVFFPTIAADVVFAENIDCKFCFWFFIACAYNIAHKPVVSYVMTTRLRNTFVAFAGITNSGYAVFGFGSPCYCLHIIANKTYGASGAYHNALWAEQCHSFFNGLFQFFLTAKHNIGFLHIGGKTIWNKVFICIFIGFCFVSPCAPTIKAAANRPVSDNQHIFERTNHNAFTTGIATTTCRHHARNCASVCGNCSIFIAFGKLQNMVFAVFIDLGRILFKQFFSAV